MIKPRLFLITGFALDRNAFSKLDLPKQRVQYLDLIEVEPGDTLATYANRLIAATDYGPRDWIGGVSLGGMLALEIARLRGTRGAVLIASATHPRFVRGIFRALATVAPEAPEAFLRLIFGAVPRTLYKLNMMNKTDRDALARVMSRFPISLLRRLPPIIMGWPGCVTKAPLYRLHSTGDWMIRFDGLGQTMKIIQGRNHLLTVSHPQICSDFLMEILNLE